MGKSDKAPRPASVSRETSKLVQPSLTGDGFRNITGASKDELGRLAAYLDLLRRWQSRINVVGHSTMGDPWRRHFLDSAQLAPLLPAGDPRLIDLGSGAGFPGLVLAIMTGARVRLVESDARKCAFLYEAARVTHAQVLIDNVRGESLPPPACEVLTARAVAPLAELLEHAYKLLAPKGCCLFLKGRGWRDELTQAEQHWKMRLKAVQSWTDPKGVLLQIEDLSRRNER